MSRLGRLLRAPGWRHALGELALIVAGVLIALAVNNWNEDRHDRGVELRVLREMRGSIALDVENFDSALRDLDLNARAIEHVRAWIGGDDSRSDSLTSDLGRAYWNAGSSLPLHTGPYEALKARGLELSNDSLRMQVVRLYDEVYGGARQSVESGDNSVRVVLRPYFLEHFRDLRPGVSATPLDPAALRRDPYFANLLSYRYSNVTNNLRPTFQWARDSARAILIALDHEIGRRSS